MTRIKQVNEETEAYSRGVHKMRYECKVAFERTLLVF